MCFLNKDQIHKAVASIERAKNLLPIILSIIGIYIHAMGLLNLIPAPVFLVDLLMLFTDLLVAYGLIKKTLWGYWLAVALYLQQSFMQPYWAYEKYISNFFILHPIEYFVSPILVIASLFILLLNKRKFVL